VSGDLTLTTSRPRGAALTVEQTAAAARGDIFVVDFEDEFGHPGGGQIAAALRGRPLARSHPTGSPIAAAEPAAYLLTLTGPRS
jgi:hypothetical protein